MGWRSFLFGFATLVACVIGAWAQTDASASAQNSPDTRTVTAVQLPARSANAPTPLRSTDGQPRYAAQIAPDQDDGGPIAAPTTRVSVSPAQPPYNTRYSAQEAAPPSTAVPQQPAPQSDTPRYARAPAPSANPAPVTNTDIERITVSALRQSDDSLYRLGPGDKLRITVFNETDLSGDFAIDGQGFVRLPLLGQIQAAGLTSFALESRIAEAFTGGGYLVSPRVAVEITGYRPFYILGEVAKPGEYPYVNSMTAPNAIALAGGFTDRATQSIIYVRHQGETTEHEISLDESARIYPGDMVRVRRSTYWSVMTWLSPIISPFATVAYLLK